LVLAIVENPAGNFVSENFSDALAKKGARA